MDMWTKKIKNPEWVKYNNLFNEGEEGYNPHKQYIISTESKNILGKPYTVAEAKEMLRKLEESLPKHTDPKKIQGCEDCICAFKTCLQIYL